MMSFVVVPWLTILLQSINIFKNLCVISLPGDVFGSSINAVSFASISVFRAEVFYEAVFLKNNCPMKWCLFHLNNQSALNWKIIWTLSCISISSGFFFKILSIIFTLFSLMFFKSSLKILRDSSTLALFLELTFYWFCKI